MVVRHRGGGMVVDEAGRAGGVACPAALRPGRRRRLAVCASAAQLSRGFRSQDGSNQSLPSLSIVPSFHAIEAYDVGSHPHPLDVSHHTSSYATTAFHGGPCAFLACIHSSASTRSSSSYLLIFNPLSHATGHGSHQQGTHRHNGQGRSPARSHGAARGPGLRHPV